MTPRQFFDGHPKGYVKYVAEKAGTNYANFKMIARHNGGVSRALAKRLAESSDNCMTRDEILFPEEYETDTEAA